MKSLSEVNKLIQSFTILPEGIQFSLEDSNDPVRLLRSDDDTAYIVSIYFEKEGNKYNQGVILYPWESSERILEKFNGMVKDLERRRLNI